MGLIKYILGSDGRRALKKLNKLALQVEALESKYAAMSDEELKGQTAILKSRLATGETLDDILFDAFAALREASWRVLKMKHFHVQIIGGICLHQGRIAEMRTGEGKTLVSTLPAYLNALTGKGVHIVTVNDYLAKRDAEWMGKVHKFMGLTVGVVVPGMEDKDKQEAYKCDIIYATNNELGFDYLRDNLKSNLSAMVQRELNFCIIDEIDSILIDEARTPLIISGRGGQSSKLYEDVDKFVRTLSGGFDDDKKEAEKKIPSRKKKELSEADIAANQRLADILEEMENWDYIIDRKDKSVTITEKGAEKAERFFNIKNLGDIENADLNHHIQQALKAHELFHRDEEYLVSNDGEILIIDEFTGRLMHGRRYSDGLHQAIEAKEKVKVREENKTQATVTFQNYFRLYNKLSGMTGTAKTEEGEFRTIYSLDVVEIPTNRPIQRIDYADMIYSTVEGKKRAIVNEVIERHANGQPILIGTATVDKSEEISRLLRRNGVKHNILNAKNHEREAEIVAQAGRFGAVTIATNMAGRGTDILLGGNAEYLAKKRMREENYTHEMIEVAISYADREFTEEEIQARERYAELYEMYKKETDAEKAKVLQAGGLCILGTERHESRRIDNQLRGRAGRQGDPGVSIFYISLEDDLAKRFGGERMKAIYDTFKIDEDQCLQSKLLSHSVENAQKAIEGRNFGARKHTLQYDEVMNEQRKTIYGERMKVLKGEDVHEQMLKYIPDYVEKVVNETVNTEAMPEKWDHEALNAALIQKVYPDECKFEITPDMLEKWDYEYAIQKISKEVAKSYEQKIFNIKQETGGQVDYRQVERNELLRAVDRNWVDHIDAMDQLRKGIGLRGYAQQDPVIAYKNEGYDMFMEMIDRIQTTTISRLLKGKIVRVPAQAQTQANNAPQGQPQRIQITPQNLEQYKHLLKPEQYEQAKRIFAEMAKRAEEQKEKQANAEQVKEVKEEAKTEPVGENVPEQPSVKNSEKPLSEKPFNVSQKLVDTLSPEQLEQVKRNLYNAINDPNKQGKPINPNEIIPNNILSSKPLSDDNVPQAPGVPLPKVNTKKNIGRNDPCPCGSGKKYKDCCYWNDHR